MELSFVKCKNFNKIIIVFVEFENKIALLSLLLLISKYVISAFNTGNVKVQIIILINSCSNSENYDS